MLAETVEEEGSDDADGDAFIVMFCGEAPKTPLSCFTGLLLVLVTVAADGEDGENEGREHQAQ